MFLYTSLCQSSAWTCLQGQCGATRGAVYTSVCCLQLVLLAAVQVTVHTSVCCLQLLLLAVVQVTDHTLVCCLQLVRLAD